MPCDDWRRAGEDELAAWYAAERQRWLSVLGWDPQAVFAQAEQARRAGRLAGFVARDDRGRLCGLTYYSTDRAALQIGTLQADRADVVRELLDGVLDSPEASLARRYQCFLFPRISGIDVALTRRRFDVRRQLYLSARLDRVAGLPVAGAGPVRAWRDDDLPAAARLLARAYAGSATGAAFAPEGRLEEWAGYVGAVLQTAACGRFEPGLTMVVEGTSPDRLGALVMTTRLSPSTVHLAQVVVDPALHRRGLATALVTHVARHAAPAADDVTLLVSEENAVARSLYDRLAFVERSAFLLAARARITRQPSTARQADVPVASSR